MIDYKDKIVIHSDGACSGNPGPGGWGAIVAFPEGTVQELGNSLNPTTNNQMELQGVIAALNFVKSRPEPIIVFTDSTYVIRGITQWIWGWMKRGWKNAEGEPVANQDFWQDLSSIVQKIGSKKISWHYVRGHQGTLGNERCDQIAVAFSKNQYCALYKGPLLGYEFNPYDVPEDTSLPEQKAPKEKVKAFSYLSVVGGTPMRHNDWASCERRVKGTSGAKFKKSTSAENEEEILASWGYSLEDIK